MSSTPPSTGTAARVHAFDHLRAWATVGVVLLHAGAGILGARLGEQTGFWTQLNAANVYDSAGRFAVNCFFMISGALLLSPERSFRLGRQLRRVAVPLAVWTVVYVVAAALLRGTPWGPVRGSVAETPLDAPVQLVRDVLGGPAAYHLWFVYVLLGLYLVVPLLRPLTALPETARRSLLLYAIGLWLVLDIGLDVLGHVWEGTPEIYAEALPDLPIGYLGLFLLGFLLHRHRPPVGVLAAAVLAALALLWIVLAVWRQQSSAAPDLWAYNNLHPPVLLLSVGVFLLGLALFDDSTTTPRAVASFSALSFRIYLAHALVLHLWRAAGPTGDLYQSSPVIGIPVVVLLTLAVCWPLAWAMEQVRPLRRSW